MKKIISILFLILTLNTFSQNSNSVVLTRFIRYNVLLSDYKEYKSQNEKLFKMLLDTNVLKDFDLYYEDPILFDFETFGDQRKLEKLSTQEIENKIFNAIDDTILVGVEIAFGKYRQEDQPIKNPDYRKDTTLGLYFNEAWLYDTNEFKFYKKTSIIGPTFKLLDDKDNLKWVYSLFNIKLKQKQISDSIWSIKNIKYDVPIQSCFESCEWNIRDNIEPTNRITFFRYILNSIYDGKIKAYKDSLKGELIKDINEFMKGPEFIDKVSYEENNVIKTEIVMSSHNKNSSDFNKIRFTEDWIFDVKNQTFIKTVKSMQFLIEEDKKKTPVYFWVFFDK